MWGHVLRTDIVSSVEQASVAICSNSTPSRVFTLWMQSRMKPPRLKLGVTMENCTMWKIPRDYRNSNETRIGLAGISGCGVGLNLGAVEHQAMELEWGRTLTAVVGGVEVEQVRQ
jgi:hypothetical protein